MKTKINLKQFNDILNRAANKQLDVTVDGILVEIEHETIPDDWKEDESVCLGIHKAEYDRKFGPFEDDWLMFVDIHSNIYAIENENGNIKEIRVVTDEASHTVRFFKKVPSAVEFEI